MERTKGQGPREALQELHAADHAMDYGQTEDRIARFQSAREAVDQQLERVGPEEMHRHVRDIWPNAEKDEVAHNMERRFDYAAKVERARKMNGDELWQTVKGADLRIEGSVRERNAAIAVMAERAKQNEHSRDRGRGRGR